MFQFCQAIASECLSVPRKKERKKGKFHCQTRCIQQFRMIASSHAHTITLASNIFVLYIFSQLLTSWLADGLVAKPPSSHTHIENVRNLCVVTCLHLIFLRSTVVEYTTYTNDNVVIQIAHVGSSEIMKKMAKEVLCERRDS